MKKSAACLLILLLVALGAVTVTACGDDADDQDGQTEGQTQEQADREYDLEETAAAAGDDLGDDAAAAYAVLKATDSGYSPYQVAEAINAGELSESGEIAGTSPERESEDMIARRDGRGQRRTGSVVASVSLQRAGILYRAAISSQEDIEQLFEELGRQGDGGRMLAWVLGATGQGYSIEQITTYLGDEELRADPDFPMDLFGVPVIVDSEGNLPEPDLEPDWAYQGRNILADLQNDPDVDFDDSLTALVIGMVNAGYSESQIVDAIHRSHIDQGTQTGTVPAERDATIGMCSAGNGDAAQFTPCVIDLNTGEIVAPDEETAWAPEDIIVEDVSTFWPLMDVDELEALAALQTGQAVTLQLRAYTLSTYGNDDPAEEYFQRVTSEEVFLTVRKTEDEYYGFSGAFDIELTQEEDRGPGYSYQPGDRWNYVGDISEPEDADPYFGMTVESDDPLAGPEMEEIRIGHQSSGSNGLNTDHTVTRYDAEGNHVSDEAVIADSGFFGTIRIYDNMKIGGRGMFTKLGNITVHWEVVGISS